jgi:diaminohydroxyphosphoribosylaminopyrimidine deaminase/5-amino-6-(5-phosphoribosylamino)uracil reductase
MWAREDEKFMRRALRLAEKGLGRTAPNPAVGAVIVRNGRIVGEGYHRKAGAPHAEVYAIRAAGEDARGATLYVTLEPCNHEGRTPPCTHAVLRAGVRRVIIGALDPNHNVVGGGTRFLREKGLEVRSGCLGEESRLLVAPFAKHLVTGLPWVRAKVACSMDGRTATRTGNSKWITNERARAFGHRMRAVSGAILVGRGTIVADDPQLTCRWGGKAVPDPVRVVLDSRLRTDPSSRVCRLESSARTIIVGAEHLASAARKKALEAAGAEVWTVPPDQQGRVDVPSVLSRLGGRGIQSVLVEGGPTVHGAFWDQGLVDEALFFYAALVIGGTDAQPAIGGSGADTLAAAARLTWVRHRKLGDDWLVQGLVSDINALWS